MIPRPRFRFAARAFESAEEPARAGGQADRNADHVTELRRVSVGPKLKSGTEPADSRFPIPDSRSPYFARTISIGAPATVIFTTRCGASVVMNIVTGCWPPLIDTLKVSKVPAGTVTLSVPVTWSV